MKRATTATQPRAASFWMAAFSLFLVCAALFLTAPAHAALRASAANLPDTVRVEACNWDRPGHDPFMGDVVAAVDRYKDIPATIRKRLKERMADRNFDEFVTIGRDTIKGQNYYEAKIIDMHFGANKVCHNVSRAGWTESMRQAGLVYCEQNHCILVPTVCRNVSRIVRIASSGPATTGRTFGFTEAPDLSSDINVYDGDTPGLGGAYVHDDTPVGVNGRVKPGPAAGGSLVGPIDTNTPMPGAPGSPFAPGLGALPGVVVPGPVPEPQEWLMYLCGLAAIAWMARRRAH
jgi:hypothetical protein